jgi:hypothetical protein
MTAWGVGQNSSMQMTGDEDGMGKECNTPGVKQA